MKGIISFWMQTTNATTYQKTFGSQGSLTAGSWETTGQHRFRATYSNGSYNSVRAYTGTGLVANTTYHLLLAWDTSTGTVTQHINDVSNINSAISTGVAPDFDSANFSIGSWADPGYASYFSGKFADFYVTLGETLDMTVTANRRKFIDAGLSPVNLGANGSTPTGNQPEVFLGGTKNYTNWQENHGSASNFTTQGTTTDGGSLGSSTSYANMTLLSIANFGTATTSPATGDIVLLFEDVGSGTSTINTHIKAHITRNGGTTWDEVTLVEKGTWGSAAKKILTANDVSFTGAAGLDMRYKITTHAQSAVYSSAVHATSLAWA